MVDILFFGRLSDLSKSLSLDIPSTVMTGHDLIAWLAAGQPELGEALRGAGIRIAIDQTLAPLTASVAGAREIAFMSALSGG